MAMRKQKALWIGGVVILVALFMSGLFWPAPTGGSDSARRTVTLTNLKQLGLGTLIYSNDYDDKMPLAGAWMSGTYPYLKSDGLYQDLDLDTKRNINPPADSHLLKLMGEYPYMQRPGVWGMAFDVRLSGALTTNIKDQEQRLCLYTSTNTGWNATDPFTSYKTRKGKSILSFVDGHAKILDSTKLHSEQELVKP
jgi:hypothetical protein